MEDRFGINRYEWGRSPLVSHKTKGSIISGPLFLKHILHLTSYFLHCKLVSHK